MFPKPTKWYDPVPLLELFCKTFSFFLKKKMELINDVWFQLLDCLNWRVENDIDNILAVSSSFT